MQQAAQLGLAGWREFGRHHRNRLCTRANMALNNIKRGAGRRKAGQIRLGRSSPGSGGQAAPEAADGALAQTPAGPEVVDVGGVGGAGHRSPSLKSRRHRAATGGPPRTGRPPGARRQGCRADPTPALSSMPPSMPSGIGRQREHAASPAAPAPVPDRTRRRGTPRPGGGRPQRHVVSPPLGITLGRAEGRWEAGHHLRAPAPRCTRHLARLALQVVGQDGRPRPPRAPPAAAACRLSAGRGDQVVAAWPANTGSPGGCLQRPTERGHHTVPAGAMP